MIQAVGESDITDAIDALEAALVDGNDLILFWSDGSTPTPHRVDNCQIGAVNYPDSTGAEYANRRTAVISFRGEVDVAGASEVVAFQEGISYSGGGARTVMQETITGAPKKFQIADETVYRATQRGSATGRTSFPDLPGPVFPGHEDGDYEPDHDDLISHLANGDLRYDRRWTYRFASSQPLVGVPNSWL